MKVMERQMNLLVLQKIVSMKVMKRQLKEMSASLQKDRRTTRCLNPVGKLIPMVNQMKQFTLL